MAQKASPYAIRLGYNQTWNTFFFAKSKEEQIKCLKRDKLMREYLYSLFPDICRLKIEYNKSKITVFLYIPEISLVLGENNSKLAEAMKGIYKIIDDEKIPVKVNLVKEENAQSIANLIAGQFEKRIRSRQIIKNFLTKLAADRGVKGVKIELSGLMDKIDMAQTKKVTQHKMSLSEIDSNIDEGRKVAITARGTIGVKILIYKGKIWQKKK